MKRALRILAAIYLAAGLVGCSASGIGGSGSSPTQGLQDFLTKIQDVTMADLQAALDDVHAHGDIDLAALQCLPAVMDFINSSPVKPGTPTIKGVFSANQLKRDVIIGGVDKNSPLQISFRKLHVACAAYVGDEARFAAEFAVMIGAASHGVPPISGIPSAIGQALPALPKP